MVMWMKIKQNAPLNYPLHKYCSVAATLRKAGATIKWTVKVEKA